MHRQNFKTCAPAKAAIFEYIEVFYNRQRRHWISDATTGLQQYDWEHGRIEALVILSGNRDEVQYPFFGNRQIAAYLPRSEFLAGRHRVRRLMGIMGLQAIYKRPNTAKKHCPHKIRPPLLRKLPITRPNRVWCRDITYIPVRNGFL